MNTQVAVQVAFMTVLLFFAVFGVPSFPKVQRPDSPKPADASESDLLDKAKPIAAALAKADDVDRALWASTWEKVGEVVAEEATSSEPVITNTKELRWFTIATLEFAWRRMGNVREGEYPALRDAVEAFLADPAVIGKDEVVIDAAYRQRYADACRAIAYAGRNRG